MLSGECHRMNTIDHDKIDAAKLTGRRTFADKKWVGPVKLSCIISVPEKLSWFIRHLSDGLIYSIQICEISHQTFGRSHRKCPMCPMIFMNTLVCIIMFKISKISPKSLVGLVKAKKKKIALFDETSLHWSVNEMAWCHQQWSGNKSWTSVDRGNTDRLIHIQYMSPCVITRPQWVNSLAPGRFQFNFREVIFNLTLVNGGWGTSYEIAFRWMPLDLTDDKSTLVKVMAWCRQATSHYLKQCWPISLPPYAVNMPQWVKWSFQNVSSQGHNELMFFSIMNGLVQDLRIWKKPKKTHLYLCNLINVDDRLIMSINTLKPEWNGHYFPDGIFKYIFMNEKFRVLTQILLPSVPGGPIDCLSN